MLIGNLGKDPEPRFTQAGLAVASFSIATSEEWTDKATNEKKEKAEWHSISTTEITEATEEVFCRAD